MANQNFGSVFFSRLLKSSKNKIKFLQSDDFLTNYESNSTVKTNKEDYQPGETAYITASGFTPGESVELQVLHLDSGADGVFGTTDDVTIDTSGDGHKPWRVKDGGKYDLDGEVNGSVLTTWYVNPDDSANATFQLTATGLRSGTVATDIFTDSVTLLDLTNPSAQSSGSLQDASGNSVLFATTSYPGGNSSTTSFLRLKTSQGSAVEKGYNTGGTVQFDTQKQGTIPIRLSDLPSITIDNTSYYEFRIDLNESNSNPDISLTKLQVFQSNISNITGYNSTTNQLGGLNPVINLNGTVLLNSSLNSGSGVGDVLVYLPGTAFTGNPYIYTYAEFQNADSGYEEFSYGTTTALGTLADLSLTQTISNTALSVGNQATFTLTLNNGGSANATGVKVKDLLPSGFSFVSVTPSLGTYNNQTGIWNVGSIASGSNATLTLTGTVLNAASASAYTNVAEIIAANQFDPDSAVNNGDPTEDDYTSQLAPVGKLTLDKKFTLVNQQAFTDVKQAIDNNADGIADQFIALPGDDVTFTLTVTNQGFANATGVKIFDDLRQQLPIGLKFLNFSNLDGGISIDTDNNAQTIEVLFNSIAAGTSKTVTVNAKVSNDYITPVKWSGKLGTTEPGTSEINTALPEYYEATFNGTFFLNYNLQKGANAEKVNFDFLNITNSAEVVAVNGNTLNPGSITASSRLDVSTYKIEGTLNNGEQFKVFSVENLTNPNSSEPSFFFNPDPDSGSDSTGYPYYNQSQFLQPGQTGVAAFLGTWIKSSDPQYLANLAAWLNLGADGDLSNTQDEQAVINALVDFINDGVYSRDLYSSGSFSFNNGTQTQKLTFEAGEISPIINNSVNLLVRDTGVFVTDNNGNSLSTFTDLQTALDSFNFANPTGINVTIQDSSGDGLIQTKLQKIGSSNFDKNWSIQDITVDSNVNQVIFVSGNASSNLDFSLQNIIAANPNTVFTLQGDNSIDKITGTRFNDVIQGLNGSDILFGFNGDDLIAGGNGSDIFTGGRGNDTLTGGSGADEFVFAANFGNDIITDFEGQDKINFSQLSITSGALDSNNDGIINANDYLADVINGNLKLDLTSLSGGSITLTGVNSVNLAAFIL
ncbi:hypothetical protein NIES4074_23090 [Cylindrospermum sp. NIES-4074]|nr:hypothetical protein NIES4074_23090 [Cylindrospermum sp. NIES-4074]